MKLIAGCRFVLAGASLVAVSESANAGKHQRGKKAAVVLNWVSTNGHEY